MLPGLYWFEGAPIDVYGLTLLVAAAVASFTLWRRAGRYHFDEAAAAGMLAAGLLGGWLGSRAVTAIMRRGLDGLVWSLVLPHRAHDTSFTLFLCIGGACAAAWLLFRGKPLLFYLDVLAPSLLLSFAIVKIGCLASGCCSGTECPSGLGIRYPFGSLVYARQWREGLVLPPAALLRRDASGETRLLGHADAISARSSHPSESLQEHARRHGLTVPELAALARANRSLAVWPLPVAYSIMSLVLWLISEWVFRLRLSPGVTAGFVVASYGAMRLVFDGLLHSNPAGLFRFAVSQTIGAFLLAAGAILIVLAIRHERKGALPRQPD